MIKSEKYPEMSLNICFLHLSEDFPRYSKTVAVLISHGKQAKSFTVPEKRSKELK